MAGTRVKCAVLCCVAIFGTCLFILTCVFDQLFQVIVSAKMRQMLALTPTSYSYNYWHTPPVPVVFEIYALDIVNPDEVLQGARPVVREKGPYTYRVSLEKFNVTFNSNHTVTYRQRQTFYFDRDRSVGSDNDTFMTVNAPLFTVGTLLQFEYPWLQETVNIVMEALEEKPLVNVSVHDIFWGYEDRFLRLAKDVLDKLHLHSKLITGVFGYYMGRNATDDGLYTVHTGTDDLSKFLVIDRWNGLELLNYWSTGLANMINGTDGSLYPPFVTKDRVLQMYDSNLYRSMSMEYETDSNVLGIHTLKFVVQDKEFANATVNPWNSGFCTPNTNHCMPSGVLNCSAMGNGAPLYLSLPHFLGADSYYFNLVSGMQPDREKHQPYFHLHQLTGVCLSAARCYQLNIQMKEYPFLSKTRGLRFAYVPVLWINGLAEIDEQIRDLFQTQIETPLGLIMDMHYVLYGVGPVMVLVPLLCYTRHRLRARRQSQPLANSQTSRSYGSTDAVSDTSPLVVNTDESSPAS